MKKYHSYILISVAVYVTILYLLPMLYAPTHNILDCPFDKYQMEIKKSEMWCGVDPTRGRVKPAFYWMLLVRDAVGGTNPLIHYIFQAAVLCGILYFLAWLVLYFGKNLWFALLAMAVFCVSPPAVETFFTLNKQDQLVVFWLFIFTACSLSMVKSTVRSKLYIVGVSCVTLFSIVGMYFSKETGTLSFPINITVLLICLYSVWKEKDFRKYWFTSTIILNIIAFGIFVIMYMRLPYHYSIPGNTFDATFKGICLRLPDHLMYMWQTTAPVIVFLIIGICVLLYVPGLLKKIQKTTVPGILWALAGIAVYWGLTLCWTRFVERYFIIPYSFFAVLTGLVGCLLVQYAQQIKNKIGRILLIVFICMYTLWTGLFIAYGTIVRWYGEGLPRMAHANVTTDMLEYIARHVPHDTRAQFVLMPTVPEVINNMQHYLKYFEDRDDIRYSFPHTCKEVEPGYLVVPVYRSPVNFARMAVHHGHTTKFWKDRKEYGYDFETQTNIIYSVPVKYVTTLYGKFQYETVFGIPCFWKIHTDDYEFGWEIYKKSGKILNGDFSEGFAHWNYWRPEMRNEELIQIVRMWETNHPNYAVRICNPRAERVGIKQNASVVSGNVYRLSAKACSMVTNASDVLFGGRVALWQKGKKEKQLLWMSEYNRWWEKELIFTSDVSCVATLYVSMGYGNVASTGLFTNIQLEDITEKPNE